MALKLPEETREALHQVMPVVISIIPMAMLFGAAARALGLTTMEAGLMSLFVFAGGAQFAAIELWTYPLPVAALVFSAFLINSRHILMSASLFPKLKGFSRTHKFVAAYFLLDESWALAEQRMLRRPVTPAYWWGLVTLSSIAWTAGTFAGAALGSMIGDPKVIGADFVLAALFTTLIVGFWKGQAANGRNFFQRFAGPVSVVLVSGIVSAAVYVTIGSPWHVASGALAGIIMACLTARVEDVPA